MRIIINGIDMPTNCTRCPCSDDGSRFCRAANKYIPMLGKPNFCPLVEAEERKTGEWCVTPDGKLVCSNCYKNPTNRIIVDGSLIYDMTPIKKTMRYCPNCGADMKGEEHE